MTERLKNPPTLPIPERKVVILGTIDFKGKIKIETSSDPSEKKKRTSSGGWELKKVAHDQVQKVFGCESIGCEICNYRKINNILEKQNIPLNSKASIS